MHDLVIVGAGGFGHEVHGWLWDAFSPEEYRFKGFLSRRPDDDADLPVTWLADPLEYVPAGEDRFVLAIGDLDARRRVTDVLVDKGARFVSFVHPTAIIAANAKIGAGAVIYPLAVVSHSAELGDFVHLSLHASVGHDAHVGGNCYLSPCATLNGEARIDSNVFMGSHASVGPRVRVGRNSTICSGSCVLRDAAEDSFLAGVPARRTSRVDMEVE